MSEPSVRFISRLGNAMKKYWYWFLKHPSEAHRLYGGGYGYFAVSALEKQSDMAVFSFVWQERSDTHVPCDDDWQRGKVITPAAKNTVGSN